MDVTCIRCDLPNPPQARFCRQCGSTLPAPDRSSASSPFGNFALVVAAVVSLAAASAALEPLRHPWQRLPDLSGYASGHASARSRLKTLQHSYALGKHKAEAMYKLLAPRDVKVFVQKRDGEISIKGTPWEVGVLNRFVELITRKNNQDAKTVKQYIDNALRASKTSRKYRLPSEKREALYEILALDDVPLFVKRPSGRKLEVTATAKDQETVRGVVEILRGTRDWCECRGIGCWLGFQSSDCLSRERDVMFEAEADLEDARLRAETIVDEDVLRVETMIQGIAVPELSGEQIELSAPPEACDQPQRCPDQRKP